MAGGPAQAACVEIAGGASVLRSTLRMCRCRRPNQVLASGATLFHRQPGRGPAIAPEDAVVPGLDCHSPLGAFGTGRADEAPVTGVVRRHEPTLDDGRLLVGQAQPRVGDFVAHGTEQPANDMVSCVLDGAAKRWLGIVQGPGAGVSTPWMVRVGYMGESFRCAHGTVPEAAPSVTVEPPPGYRTTGGPTG